MDEPLVQTVTGRSRARLSPLVTGYAGNRIEGAEPVCTAVCCRVTWPSSVTLDLATMPSGPARSPPLPGWPAGHPGTDQKLSPVQRLRTDGADHLGWRRSRPGFK